MSNRDLSIFFSLTLARSSKLIRDAGPSEFYINESVEGRTRGRRLRLCASDRPYGATRP